MKGKVLAVFCFFMVLAFSVSFMVSCKAKRIPTDIVVNTPVNTATKTRTPLAATATLTRTTVVVATPTTTSTTGPVVPGFPYDFESGAQSWTNFSGEITGTSAGSSPVFVGSGALNAAANFTTTAGGDFGVTLPSAASLAGQYIYARVYAPLTIPQYSSASIFVKSGLASDWYAPAGYNLYRGGWTELILNCSNAVNPADIREVGIKVGPPGTFAGSWAGTITVDEVRVGGAFTDGAYNFTTNQTALWGAEVESGDQGAIKSILWDNTFATKGGGTGSLKAACLFDSAPLNAKGVVKRSFPTPINLTGRTISVDIYIPAGMIFPDASPYGLQIYVKDSGYDYGDGGWFNLNNWGSAPSVTAPGWYTFTWNLTTTPPPGTVDITSIYEVGFQFTSQANYYTGSGLYFDNITW